MTNEEILQSIGEALDWWRNERVQLDARQDQGCEQRQSHNLIFLAHYTSGRNEPMRNGVSAALKFIYVSVTREDLQPAVDMRAYLLATAEVGVLDSLVQYGTSRVVWEQGMPAPGSRVTKEMVGLSFEEAVAMTFKK